MNYYDGVILKPSLDELYLEHHGVKGQKWGVKNGPPYPLQVKSYKSLEWAYRNDFENAKKPGGPFSRTPNDFIIQKGAPFTRWTNNPKEEFNKRIYVTGSSFGDAAYMDIIGTTSDTSEHMYEIKYQLTKDIKFAGINEVNKAMSKAFGFDIDLSERNYVWEDYLNDKITREEAIERCKKEAPTSAGGKAANSFDSILDFMYDKKFKKQRDAFIKILQKDGYDAILDPVDSYMGEGSIGVSPTASIIISDCLKKTDIYDQYSEVTENLLDKFYHSLYGISLDQLYLEHHGVKGQKWGVRRYQNQDGTLTKKGRRRYESIIKVNDDLYLAKNKKRGLAKILSKNKKIASEQKKSRDYDVLSNNKKIGDLSLYDIDPKTTNITWLGINTSERGRKRAQNIMDWVISNETKSGKDFLTLEVPGTSNDARHIYEKKGFKAGSQISSEDDVWGGLTEMKKRLR